MNLKSEILKDWRESILIWHQWLQSALPVMSGRLTPIKAFTYTLWQFNIFFNFLRIALHATQIYTSTLDQKVYLAQISDLSRIAIMLEIISRDWPENQCRMFCFMFVMHMAVKGKEKDPLKRAIGPVWQSTCSQV